MVRVSKPGNSHIKPSTIPEQLVDNVLISNFKCFRSCNGGNNLSHSSPGKIMSFIDIAKTIKNSSETQRNGFEK